MPRYFFDTRTDDRFIRNEEGLVLDGLDAARAEATDGLADLARDTIANERAQKFSIEVRDESGKQVLKATVSAAVEVTVDPSP